MVDKFAQSIQRHTSSRDDTGKYHNGCQSFGLGQGLGPEERSGEMVHGENQAIHQSPGASGDTPVSLTLQHGTTDMSHLDSDGQRGGKHSHEQAGGIPLLTPAQEGLWLFSWVENHQEAIHAEHMRGFDNVQADWLSTGSGGAGR